MKTHPLDLTPCLEHILAFRHARDWEKFHLPKELAAAIAIEAAELQELFLWKGIEEKETVKRDSERFKRVSEEVADITIFLLLLIHDLDIDLADAVNRKMTANEQRYPLQQHKGIACKATP